MRRRSSRSSCALFFAAATGTFAAHVSAQQSDPVSADRPDHTTGVYIVQRAQAELGYTLTHATGVTQHSIGELLFRFPITTRAELRLAPNSLIATRVGGISSTAMMDATIGTKIRLSENTGVILDTTIPTGGAPIGGRGTTPEAVFLARLPLNERLTAAMNTGVSWNREAGGRSGAFNGSAEVGYSVGPRTGSYLEVFGMDLTRRNVRTSFINTGVMQQIGRNAQIDFRVGRSLDTTHSWFIGAGIAHRW